MNNSQPEDLFTQVRTAHRLLAAYYQRLLPTLEQIAHSVNTEFYFWHPVRFDKPGKNPFKKWQWDLLPATNTRYVFKQFSNYGAVTLNDYIVEFIVINDSGVNDEEYQAQPDALKLKIPVSEAESVLRVAIYRAVVEKVGDFYQLWEAGSYPNYCDSAEVEQDNLFLKYGFEVPLDSLLTEEGVEAITARIQQRLEETKQVEPVASL
ncbi:hypothetical protein ACFFUS_15155 [Vibrio gallaecicus]|uniref:hypothetical protein n=1 Tax=Vibrio gallaecicus TaxID=552386 RepID=UPI0010C97578|nr:hypothetical protein [Vibrio gallaecicus]MDN3614247.1 hypothetical protein [Vibrio gallaecicus]